MLFISMLCIGGGNTTSLCYKKEGMRNHGADGVEIEKQKKSQKKKEKEKKMSDKKYKEGGEA